MKKRVDVFFYFIICGILLLQIACSSSSNDGNVNPAFIELEEKPSTNASIQKVSVATDTTGVQSAADILHNTNGDAIAVWRVSTGAGIQLRYAFKPKGSMQWSDAKIIVRGSSLESSSKRLRIPESGYFVTNGNQFALVWNHQNQVFVSQFDPAVLASWTSPLPLGDLSAQRERFTGVQIASNGTSFLTTWHQGRIIYSKLYLNGTWQAQATQVVDVRSLSADTFGVAATPLLVASGLQYAILFPILSSPNSQNQMAFQIFDNTVASSWSNPTYLSVTGIDGRIPRASLRALNNGFLAVWEQTSTFFDRKIELYASDFQRTVVGPEFTPVRAVTKGTYLGVEFSVAINGNAYAVAWAQKDALTSSPLRIAAAVYDPESALAWSDPILVSGASVYAYSMELAYFGGKYSLLWREGLELFSVQFDALQVDPVPVSVSQNSGYQDIDLVVHQSKLIALWRTKETDGTHRVVASDTEDGINWSAPLELQQFSYSIAERYAGVIISDRSLAINSYQQQLYVSWSSELKDAGKNISKPYYRIYDTAWRGVQTLSDQVILGSSQLPKTVTNSAGHTLAAWFQFDNGSYQLFASVRKQGKWSPPRQIDSTKSAVRRRVDEYSANQFQVAAQGGGFAVSWLGFSDAIYVQLYDGLNWLTNPESLRDKDFAFVPYGPLIHAYKDSYVVYWVEIDPDLNTRKIVSSRKRGSQWQQGVLQTSNEIVNINVGQRDFAITPEKQGNAVLVWLQADATEGTNIFALIKNNDQWQSAGVQINTTSLISISNLSVSTTQSGMYGIAWHSSSGSAATYTSIYDQISSSWTTSELLAGVSQKLAFAANDETFALTLETKGSIVVYNYDAQKKIWGPQQYLSGLITFPDSLNMVANGDKFAIVWNNYLDTQGIIGIAKYTASKWWSSTIAIAPDQSESIIQAPSLSKYRDEYALTWGQINIQQDSSLVEVFSKIGGIYSPQI